MTDLLRDSPFPLTAAGILGGIALIATRNLPLAIVGVALIVAGLLVPFVRFLVQDQPLDAIRSSAELAKPTASDSAADIQRIEREINRLQHEVQIHKEVLRQGSRRRIEPETPTTSAEPFLETQDIEELTRELRWISRHIEMRASADSGGTPTQTEISQRRFGGITSDRGVRRVDSFDAERFDKVIRTIDTDAPRRQAVRGLGGAALALLATLGVSGVAAQSRANATSRTRNKTRRKSNQHIKHRRDTSAA